MLKKWNKFLNESRSLRGPKDFLYDISTSADEIYIKLLDMVTKKPAESKKEDTGAYIKLEKRIDVPHWEVAWSSSPKNSKGVGTIMYLMALELAEEGVSPDSYETSPSALRVWGKFMKKNEYGVKKKKKGEFKHESDENPFFFVFFKPKKSILGQFSDNITQIYQAAVQPGSTPDLQDEPDIKPYDPEDWEEYADLY